MLHEWLLLDLLLGPAGPQHEVTLPPRPPQWAFLRRHHHAFVGCVGEQVKQAHL